MSTNTASYNEATLVSLLKKRDRSAYDYLYDNYSSVLYGAISRIVPRQEETNDLLQEVFIKIWNGIDGYNPLRGRLYTWMLNIARNTSIDYVRSRHFQSSIKNQNIDDSVNSINRIEKIEQQTDNIGIRQLVDRLPEDQRKLIELIYLKGYTQDETSKELNVPLGTVKSRVRSAMITLRNVYKE